MQCIRSGSCTLCYNSCTSRFYLFIYLLQFKCLTSSYDCHQHFGGSTGYGHDEGGGREALDQVFAEIVGAESAIVRSQVFSYVLSSPFLLAEIGSA